MKKKKKNFSNREMISDIFNSLEMKNEHFKVYKQDMKFMQHKNNILATKKKKKERERNYIFRTKQIWKSIEPKNLNLIPINKDWKTSFQFIIKKYDDMNSVCKFSKHR